MAAWADGDVRSGAAGSEEVLAGVVPACVAAGDLTADLVARAAVDRREEGKEALMGAAAAWEVRACVPRETMIKA